MCPHFFIVMIRSYTSREAYVALNMLDQIGPVRTRKLIAALGSPEQVFEASVSELERIPGFGRELASSIVEGRRALDPAAEEQRAARAGIRLVTFLDEGYPPSLKEIHDPPLVLYVRGEITKADRHGLAVVGTRHATHYGTMVADRLAYGLAKAGFTINSGLARGIDTVAHQAALKAGGRTLAVLGGAIDKLYPAENAELAERISGQGAVISEYPMGRPPDRQTFPYRNRIVTGMSSMGVVVVEAGEKSGAMITAHTALDQGRQVFAVPGRIDSPASRGCHALLKQGARLVETIDDIVEELGQLLPKGMGQKAEELRRGPEVAVTAGEAEVLKALARGGLHVDALARASGMTASALNSLLLGLEMKRVVRILPGRFIELREALAPVAQPTRSDD